MLVSAMMGEAMAAACNSNAGLVVSASNLNTLIRKKTICATRLKAEAGV